MKLSQNVIIVLLLAATLLAGCSSSNTAAGEQENFRYPEKPIDFVVPYGAGGSNDIVARLVSDYLSKEWGQTINVINKPGGGGATGVQEVLNNAKPDGYTVVGVSTSNTSTLLAQNTELPFVLEDFRFLAKVIEDPLAFVVKTDAPYEDLKDLSDWAKSHPEQVTFTTAGPGGTHTFAVAEWLEAIGGDFSKARMITISSAAEGLTKVASGEAAMAIQNFSEISTMVKAGKVKVLGILGKERTPYYTDASTSEEQGITGLTVKFWNGIAAPRDVPDEVVAKWEEAIEKMSNDPEFIAKLKEINSQPAYLNSADFTAQVKAENEKYSEIAIRLGIRK